MQPDFYSLYKQVKIPLQKIWQVGFSYDSKVLAVCHFKQVDIFETQNFTLTHSFKEHTKFVYC